MGDRETEKRIIVIGSDRHWGVKAVLWTAEEMPNIADFANVIIDTSSLSSILEKAKSDKTYKEKNEQFLRKIKENQEFVRERLIHLLHSNGNIYTICSPERWCSISAYTSLGNYEWSPLPIGIVEEQGDTIEKIDNSFAHYFQFVKKWFFCFEELEHDYSLVKQIHDFYRGEYYVRPQMRVIAENRYTRPISIALWYELYHFKYETELEKAIASASAFRRYENRFARSSGGIILLPTPTEIESREAVNLLLENVWGIQQKTLPPEGIDKILLPGEDSLKQRIKEKLATIERLKAEISQLETHEEEKTQFKQLVYETGDPLADICKLTFGKLGCTVDDSVEDFILIKGDKEAIVEVKGREGTILRADGSQLAQNRRNYAVQKGKGIREVKAILLGNPWRLVLPLQERNKKGPFSPHLVEDARTEDMTLVTTVELFKAYCEFLEGTTSSEQIIERVFSGIGQTKLVEE